MQLVDALLLGSDLCDSKIAHLSEHLGWAETASLGRLVDSQVFVDLKIRPVIFAILMWKLRVAGNMAAFATKRVGQSGEFLPRIYLDRLEWRVVVNGHRFFVVCRVELNGGEQELIR